MTPKVLALRNQETSKLNMKLDVGFSALQKIVGSRKLLENNSPVEKIILKFLPKWINIWFLIRTKEQL